MKIFRKKGKKNRIFTLLSVGFFSVSLVCTAIKLGGNLMQGANALSTLSTGLIMPTGAKAYIEGYKYEYSDGEIYDLNGYDTSELETQNEPQDDTSTEQTNLDETTCPKADKNGGKKYNIIEKSLQGSGTKYDNFYIKNTTTFNIDIGKALSQRPDVKIKTNSDVQVLIVHTHTSEAYIDKDLGYYTSDFFPRCSDQKYNIVAVGEAIKKQLVKAGINTLHDTTVHDSPSYNGAYTRTANTIEKDLEKYPSIQVVLDIHRDAIGNDDTGRVKPTFTYKGKKAAQIMIISGCNEGGTWYFPDWRYNLRLALRIQQQAEKMYPGMTRDLNFSQTEYNMSITHGSLLIEVGSDVNTFDEALYSGKLLGNVIREVLLKLQK